MVVAKFLWPTTCAGLIIFFIMYFRIRDNVDSRNQSKLENVLIMIALVLLLADVSVSIVKRMDQGKNMNDCIGFYRYFPDFEYPEDYKFSFLEKCNDLFTEKEIKELIESGRIWNIAQIAKEENNEKYESSFEEYYLNKLLINNN